MFCTSSALLHVQAADCPRLLRVEELFLAPTSSTINTNKKLVGVTHFKESTKLSEGTYNYLFIERPDGNFLYVVPNLTSKGDVQGHALLRKEIRGRWHEGASLPIKGAGEIAIGKDGKILSINNRS